MNEENPTKYGNTHTIQRLENNLPKEVTYRKRISPPRSSHIISYIILNLYPELNEARPQK